MIRSGVFNGRVFVRALVVYEGKKKILALANRLMHCAPGKPDSFHFGFCRCTFRIYFVLRCSLSLIADYWGTASLAQSGFPGVSRSPTFGFTVTHRKQKRSDQELQES